MTLLSISTDLAIRDRERSLARCRAARAASPRPSGIDLRLGRVSIVVDGRAAAAAARARELGISGAR